MSANGKEGRLPIYPREKVNIYVFLIHKLNKYTKFIVNSKLINCHHKSRCIEYEDVRISNNAVKIHMN